MSESVLGSLIIFGLMAAMAVMFLVMARKTLSGTLRPNAFFGIRTPAMFRSTDSWYAGHRAAVPQMEYSALAFGATAVGALVNAVVAGPKWVIGALVIANSLLVLPLMVRATVVAGRAAGPPARR